MESCLQRPDSWTYPLRQQVGGSCDLRLQRSTRRNHPPRARLVRIAGCLQALETNVVVRIRGIPQQHLWNAVALDPGAHDKGAIRSLLRMNGYEIIDRRVGGHDDRVSRDDPSRRLDARILSPFDSVDVRAVVDPCAFPLRDFGDAVEISPNVKRMRDLEFRQRVQPMIVSRQCV